jgi:thiol-disulfide isomerase/thioredoxin
MPMLQMCPRWAVAIVAAVLVTGCNTPKKERPRGKLEVVPAAADVEVAPLVQKELTRAHSEGRQLLVYVGATWCEPCRRFHEAAAAGQLDAALPTLRLLEFDADRDNERLAVAGYFSRYIPLFALPNADGRSSGKQIEGATKGNDAAAQLAPQLRGLLQ